MVAVMASEGRAEQSYCADQVRRHDWDRFICTLFAPAERRPALFALLAFNLEISRTRAMVSERLLGEIRLQWWRDAIAAIFRHDTAALKHPVIEALHDAVATYALDHNAFEAMIDARSDEFDEDPAASLSALIEHALGTEGSLIRMQMHVLANGTPIAEPDRLTADDVAVAAAIAGLARAQRAGTGFLEHARNRLATARSRQRDIDRRYLPALLPATLAEMDLRGHQPARLRRQLAVTLKVLRGKF